MSIDCSFPVRTCTYILTYVSWIHARCRALTLNLAGAVLGLNVGDRNASAAAKRPPPPPPSEKKDPNVSGVLAKVLASKKRKEAMKESMSKLRERGKPINGPTE